MRCCEHYNPSSVDKEMHEDGVSTNGRHKFDKLLPYQTCTNPEVLQGAMMAGCPFARNQHECGFYTPEKVSLSRKVEILTENGTRTFMLGNARATFGIREYHILEEVNGEETILQSFSSFEHGETKARELSENAFGNLLETTVGNRKEIKLSPTSDNEHSYLMEIVNA